MMYTSTMEYVYPTAVAKNTDQPLRSSADALLPLFCKFLDALSTKNDGMFANFQRDGQYGHEQPVGGSCDVALAEAPPAVGSWMCGANAESDGR